MKSVKPTGKVFQAIAESIKNKKGSKGFMNKMKKEKK